MIGPVEFDCIDCGIHVVAFNYLAAANSQDLCFTCQWIRSIEDPEEREKLRAFLNKAQS